MAQKKTTRISLKEKRALIDSSDPNLPISRQCELLSLARSSFYYKSVQESVENLHMMECVDEIHTKYPFYGSRRILNEIRLTGVRVNRKKIKRFMTAMDIETRYPKKRWKQQSKEQIIYPYLLKDFCPITSNEVWCSDITYIPTQKGYFYLVAIMDWYSRYVLAWNLSNSMEAAFCVKALEKALERGSPRVFNTDQGSQFTSNEFTNLLLANGIDISMDHKGRCFDNIFIERLWRSLKYEEVYLHDYVDGLEAYEGIKKYFSFYNNERRHTAFANKTPRDMHFRKIR